MWPRWPRASRRRRWGSFKKLAGFRTVALPLSADGERVEYRSPPPRLGEHSAQILAEAGYSDADITELAAVGVTRLEGPRPVT